MVGDGGLIWNFRSFEHKEWLVTTQNKESFRYHGIFYFKKNLTNFSPVLITVFQ